MSGFCIQSVRALIPLAAGTGEAMMFMASVTSRKGATLAFLSPQIRRSHRLQNSALYG